MTSYIGWRRVEDTMNGIIEIQAASREAAMTAAKKHKTPYVVYDENELDAMRKIPFPFIGTHSPKGWKKVAAVFCDHSGWGSPGEPALTIDQLIEKIRAYLKDGKAYGYAITNLGQFQLWLGVYEQTTKA